MHSMHACTGTDPYYVHQNVPFDPLIIFYFIHRLIFLNYLFTRSKKPTSKISLLFDVIGNLVWPRQDFFYTFWFSSSGEKILQKNYLRNKIGKDPCIKTNLWMCISWGFVHECMVKMPQCMKCA